MSHVFLPTDIIDDLFVLYDIIMPSRCIPVSFTGNPIDVVLFVMTKAHCDDLDKFLYQNKPSFIRH